MIAGGGHAVDVVERCHRRANTRIDAGLVWREIIIVHFVGAHVYGVVIATGFGGTIQTEMFHTGQDVVWLIERILNGPLVAFYHRRTHCRTQKWIFSGAFAHPSPARIPGDIDHRREGPVETIGS